jgi:Ca2+-binding RTX toxin-like protein
MAEFVGTLGSDTYTGTIGSDQIFGFGGNDSLEGVAFGLLPNGDDTILGGSGSDTLWTNRDGQSSSFLAGGDDPDRMTGGGAHDTILGGLGDDWLMSSSGHARMEGGGGNDAIENFRIVEMAGGSSMFGGAGDDFLDGYGHEPGLLDGGPGDDGLSGGLSDDTIMGGLGNDTFYPSWDVDFVEGLQMGRDTLAGGPGDDLYDLNIGGRFATVVYDPVIREDRHGGTDTVETDKPSFTLPAGVEKLVFPTYAYAGVPPEGYHGTGNKLDNLLSGGAGNDTLEGGCGRDTLDGYRGTDLLAGGRGADEFRMHAGEADGDRVTDFRHGQDTLVLSGFGDGASIAQLGCTDTWTITFGGTRQTIALDGVHALQPSDYVFV